jgi:hypothetical protein
VIIVIILCLFLLLLAAALAQRVREEQGVQNGAEIKSPMAQITLASLVRSLARLIYALPNAGTRSSHNGNFLIVVANVTTDTGTHNEWMMNVL